MCLRLSNRRRCLSLLTFLGVLQSLLALPIIVLSFIQLFSTTLGFALSPFWCGFLLLGAGGLALLIRPTRLACVIFLHVLVNSFAISSCFLSAGMTGLYGTAVHLPRFQQFLDLQRTQDNNTCIFSEDSPLYTEGFRNAFRSLDVLVPSCEDLDRQWRYLISLMSLSVVGFLISLLAIVSDCVAPCVEEQHDRKTGKATRV